MNPTPLPQELIRRKRDGGTLTAAELATLAHGIADGSVSEAQIAAFAMAVYFRDLSATERVALTQAMTATGSILRWDVAGPVLDKHSTGGVGDKVSLLLAPMLAACGAYVPMISGRGLGHTGGTLDKLASLPGYDTAPSLARMQQVVREVGCAIVGQTDELAPADRRFYAVRDVTATVEAEGLIVASILCKKLAEGLHGLVLDVKTGSGAFMATPTQAHALATALTTVAGGAGLPTTALLTDMNQVLGDSAGNALEVQESLDFLTGARREPRLLTVTLALGVALLRLGGLAENNDSARARLLSALDSGAAAERFARMVAALGGPSNVLYRAELPRAAIVQPVYPIRPGYLAAIDVREVGLAVIALGGGRRRTTDTIDPTVGFSGWRGLGDWVDHHQPLAWVHAADPLAATAATSALQHAVQITDTAPPLYPPVSDVTISA